MKQRVFAAIAFAAGMVLLLIFAVGAWAGTPSDAVAEAPPQGSGAPPALSAPATATFKLRMPVFLLSSGNCTTAPVLLSPADASDSNPLCPVLTWDAGSNPNATGLLMQIAGDPAFQQVVVNVGDSGQGWGHYQMGFNLTAGATYYWRAFLMCGSELGPSSARWSFTTAPTGTIPPAPALIAPISGTVLSALPVTMEWAAVPGAIDYLVRWQRPGMSMSGEWTTQAQLSVGWLTAGAEYNWWVQARNDYALGPESPRWRFTTPAAVGAVLPREP